MSHPLEEAQSTVINPLISITLTSPHSLKSEVHIISVRQRKTSVFSQNSHTTKSLYRTLKINRIKPPNKSKCRWTDASVKWFQ